jgi:hypothetical protein
MGQNGRGRGQYNNNKTSFFVGGDVWQLTRLSLGHAVFTFSPKGHWLGERESDANDVHFVGRSTIRSSECTEKEATPEPNLSNFIQFNLFQVVCWRLKARKDMERC